MGIRVLRDGTAAACAGVLLAWAASAWANGEWRYAPDKREDRPRTLLFCPMQPDYLRDTAAHWGRVGFNGFIISVGGFETDIWARDGDASTRGWDDRYLRQFLLANRATRQHGGGWNFPKASVGERLPDWFDDAAWNRITETFRQYARFARMARSPGFAMDIEYSNKQYYLDWEGYDYDGYTGADLCEKVRERGRQMIEAMLDEYPGMELLMLPEGPVQYGALCAEWVSGFLEAMGARDAPGGFHMLTEAITYGCTDPLTLIAHPTQLRDIMDPQLSEAALDYWQRRGTIAMGAWPLGYYRGIFDEDGTWLGFGGKKEVFGDRVIGSYADKSENYPPDAFRRQLAAMRMVCERYVWVYGHGSTWWQLSEAEAARYGPLGNATLPTVKNLGEYEDVVAAREIIDDPALTPAAERLRRGKRVDLGGLLGFIGEWQIIGPFPNENNEGVTTAFPPERGIDLAASYAGKGGPVKWFEHRSDDPLRMVLLRKIFNRADQATAYGLVWVSSARSAEVELQLGSNDDLVAWWDGREVSRYEGGRVLRADLVDVVPLRVEPGTHTLLLKCCNRGRNWGFLARITDREGRPVEGIRCTAQPPEEREAEKESPE